MATPTSFLNQRFLLSPHYATTYDLTVGNAPTLNLAASKLQIAGTAVDLTAAEFNFLDITTLGTGAASKAVVLDSGDDYIWPSAGFLTYGGTQVTATGAELNILDDTANNVTIVYSTGVGTDNIVVTITVVDAAAVAIDAVHKLEVFITDDDIGGVLTSTAASGNLTATGGAILSALTAKKHVTITTAATGIAILDLVDSANTVGERFCVVNPVNGKVIVGDETAASDYEGG